MQSPAIRVLCLHGCNQTPEMFRALLRDFAKIAEKQGLQLHFAEARYAHPEGGRTWYKVPLAVADIGHVAYDPEAVSDTMQQVSDEIDRDGISFLLGFSQGSNVIDTYLRHHAGPGSPIRGAVLMSGYSLVCDGAPISRDVPVLNVVSEKDDVVSAALAPTGYLEMEVIRHDKGHKVPTSKPQLRAICDWIVRKIE